MASPSEMSEQQLKTEIKSIITSNPIVSTIQSIQQDFKEMIGTSIPFQRYGFNSVEHYLKNIPDTCVVRGTGPFAQVTLLPSAKSAHINEMVVRQKVNRKKNRKYVAPRRRAPAPLTRKPLNWQPTNYSFSPNSSNSSSSSFGYPSTAGCVKTTNNNPFANSANKNASIESITTGIDNMNIQGTHDRGVKKESYQNGDGLIVRRENVNVNLRSENTHEKTNFLMEQNKFESRKVKEQLERLIKNQIQQGNVTPIKIPAPKRQETESLSSSHMLWNAPVLDRDFLGTSNISKSESRDEYSNNPSCSYKEEMEDMSNVPNRVQLHLKTLIGQFVDGLWCSDLPGHYRRMFQKELVYMEYGYSSLIEMCIALKHIFHFVRPGRDDFKLYDRNRPLPENVEKVYTMASYDVGKKVVGVEALPYLVWADFKGHIPEDIFQLDKEIPREFLPSDTRIDNILDVVVTEIYDPSKFWFYLGTSDRTTPLDTLMDSMQAFYGKAETAKEYAIPPGAISEGLYCVQVIYGEYHRAKILRVLADSETPDHVRVVFIDYGTVCKVPIKGMCFLHIRFAELKAQAIRGRLTNILPNFKNHPWPRTTSDRFRGLMNRRDTQIKISFIDWVEEYVCVFLADVTDKDNVLYINETLVKEKHAVWAGEPQVVPFVLSTFKCKVQNIHLFPTFRELECGLTPNASEMYALEDMMVPLHFSIPQYFEPDKQIFPDDYDEGYEHMENTFIETVKNHRRFTPFNTVDISSLLNNSSIDFDVFGDLKDEMIEFCVKENLTGDAELQNTQIREDELFCDVEEAAGTTLECSTTLERSLKELDSIQSTKQSKEFSTNSIVDKLNRYRLLTSEQSSDSESVCLLPETSRNFQEELASPSDVADDLSTIYEHSEIELDNSEALESPQYSVFGFSFNRLQLKQEINIFDNPEAFEGSSVTSEDSESAHSGDTESFLKTVKKTSTKDLEEDVEHESNNGTTDTSSAVCHDSETPFSFDVDSELKKAFISFLKSQSKNSFNPTGGPVSEPSLSASYHCPGEEEVCLEGASYCEGSFLKCQNRRVELEETGSEKTTSTDLKITECLGDTDGLELFKGDLVGSRKGFISTLSVNNPFRSYLEDGENTVQTSTDHTTEIPTTIPSSLSTHSSVTCLLDAKVRDAEVQSHSSDSEGSDYKVFIPMSRADRQETHELWVQSTTGAREMSRGQRPEIQPSMKNSNRSNVRNQEYSGSRVESSVRETSFPSNAEASLTMRNQNRANNESNQESWFQNSAGARGMMTPPRTDTPPRMFIPSGCIPPGYFPYPQWSNGTGYQAPQYPQWSTGFNQQGIIRPPPGYAYQGPPVNYNSYVAPRVLPAAPIFTGPPAYYGQARPVLPPTLTPERDFYERYNESLLRSSEPS